MDVADPPPVWRGEDSPWVGATERVEGERITRNIGKVFSGVDLRDLWLPFFCVSTNLSRSRVEVHDRLDAATAIRASVAIPGICPRSRSRVISSSTAACSTTFRAM